MWNHLIDFFIDYIKWMNQESDVLSRWKVKKKQKQLQVDFGINWCYLISSLSKKKTTTLLMWSILWPSCLCSELKGPVGQIHHTEKYLLAVEQNKVLIPPSHTRYLAWGFSDLSVRIGPYESDKVNCMLSAPALLSFCSRSNCQVLWYKMVNTMSNHLCKVLYALHRIECLHIHNNSKV